MERSTRSRGVSSYRGKKRVKRSKRDNKLSRRLSRGRNKMSKKSNRRLNKKRTFKRVSKRMRNNRKSYKGGTPPPRMRGWAHFNREEYEKSQKEAAEKATRREALEAAPRYTSPKSGEYYYDKYKKNIYYMIRRIGGPTPPPSSYEVWWVYKIATYKGKEVLAPDGSVKEIYFSNPEERVQSRAVTHWNFVEPPHEKAKDGKKRYTAYSGRGVEELTVSERSPLVKIDEIADPIIKGYLEKYPAVKVDI